MADGRHIENRFWLYLNDLFPINVTFDTKKQNYVHSRKIQFLSKLQLEYNILFKTFAKSRPISEELVSLSSVLCCYILKCYNGYWLLFLLFPS